MVYIFLFRFLVNEYLQSPVNCPLKEMPVNRNALIRYRTIDNCLQNRYRKWTLDDLIEACSDSLYEYEGIDKGVSRRSVQADLAMMRSDKLGYEAPIVVVDKKYYTYEDPAYSITNNPLSQQDMQVLSEVSGLLSQFKGFSHFADVSEMVSRLEDKIYSQKTHSPSVVDFEKNENLKGLEFIEGIRKAIVGKRVLSVTYQSFKARQANTYFFSPYLLKEHRNRWFVLGLAHQRVDTLMTLALDRFQSLEESEGEIYHENNKIDLGTYYDDVIGVTKTPGQPNCEVILWTDHATAPYLITKPLHASQKVLYERTDGRVFSIRVVLNFELDREILGFGARMKVLSPRILQKRIREQLEAAFRHYMKPTGRPTDSESQ